LKDERKYGLGSNKKCSCSSSPATAYKCTALLIKSPDSQESSATHIPASEPVLLSIKEEYLLNEDSGLKTLQPWRPRRANIKIQFLNASTFI
jgi:hypothetical protein